MFFKPRPSRERVHLQARTKRNRAARQLPTDHSCGYTQEVGRIRPLPAL